MKIDVASGAIDCAGGKLTRCVKRAAFLSTLLAKDAVVTVDNDPWVTYDLTVGSFASMNVVFESDCLREIRLVLTATGETDSQWTEASEMARKQRHDSWLREQLGVGDYRFPWGSVESVFDPRALCSYIIIRYNAGGED